MNAVRGQKPVCDRSVWNVILLAAWASVEALQFLVITVFVFWCLNERAAVPPQVLFYIGFILMAAGLFFSGLKTSRNQLGDAEFSGRIGPLAVNSVCWLSVQFFAIFKIVVTGNPLWAYYLLTAALAGGVISRLAWPRFKPSVTRFYRNVVQSPSSSAAIQLWDTVFPFIVILLLYVPDMDRLLALMYASDQFYHFDSMFMAPGWAHISGLSLNVDVTSEYSMIIPVVMSRLSGLLGGFNYHNVLLLQMALVMLYFIGLYGLLRSWLQSTLIATFGVLLAVKLQMFHLGVTPVIWRYPSATVIRYLFDLIALYAVSRHCVTFQRKYLWMAFIAAGLALAHMADTGIYLTAALYVYLTSFLAARSVRRKTLEFPRDIPIVAGLYLTPLAVALVLMAGILGSSVFSRELWANAAEFAGFFIQGWGAIPMHETLKDRQFFAFFMGFFIPVVYVWTVIFVGGKCFTRGLQWKNFFVVFLSIYGLCQYQYFINRSALNSYYVVCIPYVCVLCFWLQYLTQKYKIELRRNIRLTAAVAAACALITCYPFTIYPNALNLAGKDWKPAVDFYRAGFNFDRDGGMIARLTTSDERVALISSFETAILINANRKPFFYYFPLTESTLMSDQNFRGTYLYTEDRLHRTLGQLEEGRPQYIFVDKRLTAGPLAGCVHRHSTLQALIIYVRSHYVQTGEGQYLAVWQRKAGSQ